MQMTKKTQLLRPFRNGQYEDIVLCKSTHRIVLMQKYENNDVQWTNLIQSTFSSSED